MEPRARLDSRKAQRALRRKDWTQAELARRMGCGESHMSRIFNGLVPSRPLRRKMAGLLGEAELWKEGKR